MKIVFWVNIPSINMASLWRELADIWAEEITVIAEERILESRIKLGWQVPDLKGIRIFYLNECLVTPQIFVYEYIQKHADAVHILGLGSRSADLAMKGLKKISNPRVMIISERIDFRQLKMKLKAPIYYWRFLRCNRYLSAFLAMGNLGVRSFKRLGISSDKLYPFSYALRMNPTQTDKTEKKCKSRPLRFIYVGRNSKTKGIDVLLKAFVHLADKEWQLSVAGFEPTLKMKKQLLNQGLYEKINFLGPVRHDQIFKLLAEHDVCLVPSRYDGWGMAGSEAIASGIGVIITDKVGSLDMVKYSGAGRIVRAGNISELRNAVDCLIEKPEIAEHWKTLASEYLPNLSSKRLAEYLGAILRYEFKNKHNDVRPTYPLANPDRHAQ
ncbi:glycosyltransferase [Desulfobacula toluolica]|uniref:Putative glycosyl transferase, group 1 n=1 Tax=Desulfobacula toluolica (strain DSM 7467 / Tol2) TaxID=651182 RepID=K0NDV3_DESTT|nr:glycosyltransferase [Desulfobacula toluolica]CCK78985.1 putative glycosyl transferase, group 1 [Desulfobacula toluolica Tol2]